MSEKELVRSIIDFSFIIKGQLHSDQTAVLRSILNILIMEAEDVLEDINQPPVARLKKSIGKFVR